MRLQSEHLVRQTQVLGSPAADQHRYTVYYLNDLNETTITCMRHICTQLLHTRECQLHSRSALLLIPLLLCRSSTTAETAATIEAIEIGVVIAPRATSLMRIASTARQVLIGTTGAAATR